MGYNDAQITYYLDVVEDSIQEQSLAPAVTEDFKPRQIIPRRRVAVSKTPYTSDAILQHPSIQDIEQYFSYLGFQIEVQSLRMVNVNLSPSIAAGHDTVSSSILAGMTMVNNHGQRVKVIFWATGDNAGAGAIDHGGRHYVAADLVTQVSPREWAAILPLPFHTFPMLLGHVFGE